MQSLDMFDFYKPAPLGYLWGYYEEAGVTPDDPLEVRLMSDLLRHGADANHADQLVSFQSIALVEATTSATC